MEKKGNFANRQGDYGREWAEKFRKDYKALPSLDEVLEGIQMWLLL